MNYLYWTIAIYLAFLFQGKFFILGTPLNLTVLLAYYAGIRCGETRGLFLGALIGALQDIMASSIIGPNLMSKGIVGFASSYFISGSVFRWTPLFGLIIIFALTFFDNTLVFMSRSMFVGMPKTFSDAFLIAVTQSLMNAPVGMFIRPKDAN